MKDGRRARDNAFIGIELARSTERARKWEDAGELSFALGEYRSTAAAYDGLANVTAVRGRISALEKNPAVRAGAKQEKTEIEKQRALERDIYRITDALRISGGDEDSLRTEARTRIHSLRKDMLAEKRPERRRILERTVGGLFIAMQENGRQLMDDKQYRAAESYFQLAAEARPSWSWPHTSLAQCHALMGDKKAALRDLKRALETGLSAAGLTELVKSSPKLAALMDTPEYQKLLTGADIPAR
jgi:hypothetical protein